MASRFWAGGSSSEEESEISDISDVEATNQTQRAAASRWAVQSDSDSEEEARVVKSAKERSAEAIGKSCRTIKDAIKNDDYVSIQTEFDLLLKHIEKGKKLIDSQGYPKIYIQTIVQLEDMVHKIGNNRVEQKKLGKENNKALVRIKGKLKKHTEIIQKELENCRQQQPSSSEDDASEMSSKESSEEDESEEDVSSEEENSEEEETAKSLADDKSEESDSGSESWPSSSESSSESSDEDDGQLKGRAKWLKKAPTATNTKVNKPKVPKAMRDKVRRPSMDISKRAVEEELDLSIAQFDSRIKEAVAMRGKKGAELSDQITLLRKLASYSCRLGPAREIVATMSLLGAQLFDAFNKIDTFMSPRAWRSAHTHMHRILSILQQNPGFTLCPLSMEDQADIARAGRMERDIKIDDDGYVDTLPKAGESGFVKVSGDLAAFVDRLSEEYTKSLQQTDPNTSEYISRVYDEGLLNDIAALVQEYYDRKNDTMRAANMALVRIEYAYYKHESVAKGLHISQAKREKYGDPAQVHSACKGEGVECVAIENFDVCKVHPASISGPLSVDIKPIDTQKELRDLCMYVFKHSDGRAKMRAMLCRVYHHAIHDRFHEARDLLLMSHIQEIISDADISTQILFNRMMAQLGLSAFRIGLIAEAHACLTELCSAMRTKELLAQGVQSYRYQERDPEQERLERRRQVPNHMHINLDLLETCHLASAMLLDIPNMVNTHLSDRKRLVSKALRKLLAFHERLVFEGPPETPREHVVAAAKLLAQGSWKQCSDLLCSLSVWDVLPGAGTPERVRKTVKQMIQVEALRTYLLAFGEEYDAVSLIRLKEMFELDEKSVHSVVSKMMINDEIHGAWDQFSQTIIFESENHSQLHHLALQYSDKLATLVEGNERLMDIRSGGLNSGKEDWNNHRGDSSWSRSLNDRDRGQRSSQQNGRNWQQGARPHFRGRKGPHTYKKRST